MFDCHTIGDADIVTIDAGSAELVQTVHVNQKIRKLLAIGKRFAILLLPYVDSKFKNLGKLFYIFWGRVRGGGTGEK